MNFNELDWNAVQHHPISEKLAQVICDKTQNEDPLFYRMCVSYYLTKVASTMHARINTHDQGLRPINVYVINLAPSGYGKNKGANILEDQVIHLFKNKILDETFESMAFSNLPKVAHKRAIRKKTDPDDELARLELEFERSGPLSFQFCSATVPAVKQMRHKILLAGIGSINLEMDELGSNLANNQEVFSAYLELYDQGKIKEKLVKNTAENARNETLDGKTPTNLFAFGEPNKLLDGGKNEQDFRSLLDTGYARRCFFGFVKTTKKQRIESAEEIYNQLINPDSDDFLEDLAIKLEKLGDRINFGKEIQISKENTILYLEYMQYCEQRANELPEFSSLKRKEMSSRFDKALKLAGTYAFIDESDEITQSHLMAAFKIAEESGECFSEILSNDFAYMRLARYLGQSKTQLTPADLVEILPFYPKSANQQKEILNLAIQHGYKNNIIIKREFTDGIEFISGESLKETNLDEVILSYSTDWSRDYMAEKVDFHQLHVLTQMQGYHWVNHFFKDGHRLEDKAIAGFNLVVLDVDGTVSMDTAKMLLKDYKYMMYTTKKHTEKENRFRIIMPINYTLELNGADYKEFMNNLMEWLPFEVDEQTNQRARKWRTHPGSYEYNDGMMLDALPFIPKTKKNDQFQDKLLDTQSLNNLERWFISNTGVGNRSNQLIRYALLLVDSGKSWDDIRLAVLDLNNKIPNSLDEAEITRTIMVSVAQAISKRDSA